MKQLRRIGLIVCVVLSGWAIVLAMRESHNPHGAMGGGRACATCHAGDAPRTHTVEFVGKQHVAQAYANWRTCMTCHWEKSCNDCHEKKDSAPDFHTRAFKDVSGDGRMEHVVYARVRPESCMVCHAHRYATTCGRCHKPAMENGA